MSIPSAKGSAPASDAPRDPVEAIGLRLLAALPSMRLQSASLFDRQGQVLWLNQGVLGPDEQGHVESALATLAAAGTKAHTQEVLDDGRAALFLAIRNPGGALAGLVMLMMDAKTLASGNLAARILTSAMRELLQAAAQVLEPHPVPDLPLHLTEEPDDGLALAVLEPHTGLPLIDLDPELDLAGTREDLTPAERTPLAAAPMLLQELVRLRAGGNTRRLKISPGDERQRGNAVATLEQLSAWLQAHPQVLEGEPVSFTIAVSGSALKDERLTAKLGEIMDHMPGAAGLVGFEVREPACLTLRPQVERLFAWCERAGCFAVIDDFTFDTKGLDLLRSAAVKLLKVDARLGSAALRDRLAQARVVAIAQAAKVLGMHCVAKYVDSKSGRKWLAAVGFDFAQSMAAEPLERLLR